jgi:hypothetical protein
MSFSLPYVNEYLYNYVSHCEIGWISTERVLELAVCLPGDKEWRVNIIVYPHVTIHFELALIS